MHLNGNMLILGLSAIVSPAALQTRISFAMLLDYVIMCSLHGGFFLSTEIRNELFLLSKGIGQRWRHRQRQP